MSSCISSHGEYSEHEITTTPFTCDQCGVFDEAAAMAEIDRLNDLVTRWKDTANAADNVIRATLAELHAEPDSDPVLIARKRMDEIDRLNATIQRARELHEPFTSGLAEFCTECSSYGYAYCDAPCPTILALEGGES